LLWKKRNKDKFMSELVYVFVMNYSKEVLCFVNETVKFKKKHFLKLN